MIGHRQMDRRIAVACLLADREDMLVVSGLGGATCDVFAAGDAAINFYIWGAMGSAALVGLGLAQSQPTRKVLAITSDGEQLMGFGGLATIAVACPRNLIIAVVDNGHFGETGMQLSHTGRGIDLAKAADALGFAYTETVSTLAELKARRTHLWSAGGPALIVLKVEPEDCVKCLPPRNGAYLKNRFRQHLGFSSA